MNSSEYAAAREKQLARRRRLIFNNDGGDINLVFRTAAGVGAGQADPAAFLARRTTPLADSHVDTISYCSGVTGVFSHRTKVGWVARDIRGKQANAFIAQGTDSLQMQVDFCRAHGKEIFWSLRMNDTHDAGREWMFEQNRLKTAHPEYLLGKKPGDTLHGAWSAFDYAVDQVREFIFRLVEETCANYDIDGVELDFFRHPVFFRSTAQGRPAADSEREAMTGLLRRIAAMTEEIGRRRGRPFLVAARTPDNLDYCETIGLELERWLRERLIDIFIPSAYIRLSRWEESVRLGHRYRARVYPGLSESRVGGGHHADPLRSSDECYRARAAAAWQAGADGLYIFNLFDPHRRPWHEMGDPALLAGLDKLYFASNRGAGKVAGGAYPHRPFISVPTLNPGDPLELAPGGRLAVPLALGGLPGDTAASGPSPRVSLWLKLDPLPAAGDPGLPLVVFNGRQLDRPSFADGWVRYRLDPRTLRAGANTVEVVNRAPAGRQLVDLAVACDHSGAFLDETAYLEQTRKNM